jgi:COP9 signalosome complex subunit 6
MLHQRINLIKAYLAELPQSYLTDASIPAGPSDPPLNHQLLREISSMLSRLPLLAPPTTQSSTTIPVPGMPQSALATASAQEQSDVHMVSLLASLTRTVAQAKDMGSKYSIVQKAKTDKSHAGMMGGGRGGGGFSNYGGPGPADDPWGTPGGDSSFINID